MVKSPFKFLDAYEKEDKDIFFGRDMETETLYQMTYQSNLILVYGMSGTGKTSIIRCGLSNKFDNSDWFDIYIRRNEEINKTLQRKLKSKDSLHSFEESYSTVEKINSLYLDHLRPIYLIFDQFEEIFILGEPEEQMTFIHTIKELLDTPDLPCKIIIIMREEYLAHMSDFEKIVPTLFDKRLRIEPMNRANASQVIIRTANNPRYDIELCYEELAGEIIDNITEGKGRVSLTYLQVFLDRLYRIAAKKDPNHITFDAETLTQAGQIDDVLGSFLDDQLKVFATEVDSWEEAMVFLKTLVSNKGTKYPVRREELTQLLPDYSEARINIFLDFFVNRRIIRPLDDHQYEIAHDSLAAKIFSFKSKGINMPHLETKSYQSQEVFIGLEPYNERDAGIFFGREKEIKLLFDKVVNEINVRTTLVIGAMGVGKTSLVKAGLIPRIRSLFEISYLRCSREFLETAEMQQIFTIEPQTGEVPKLLDLAFKWHKQKPSINDRKIIIFDQFEEFFIWIKKEGHLSLLFLHLGYLLENSHNLDLIIVVRDQFFAQLQELEAFVPQLMEEQIRVRPVEYKAAKEIIKNMAQIADISFEPQSLIDKIIQNTQDESGKINLTYLQLYMERLYDSVNPKENSQQAEKEQPISSINKSAKKK